MPPSDGRYKVMVSSTIADLETHRKAVFDAISRNSMIPVALEFDSALFKDPIAYSRGLVEEAEIYVLLLAYRYGYVPEEDNPKQQSLTEMEYRRALERGIPILGFLMDGAHPGPKTAKEGQNFYESDPDNKEKLDALKDDVSDKFVRGSFTSVDNLGMLVYQSLTEPDLREQLATARADDKPEDEAEHEEKPKRAKRHPRLPKPPDFYIAHDYTGKPQPFVGRNTELDALDEWAAGDNTTLVVEAIGGIGKSALTWEWVHSRARDQIDGLAGVVWWSFYESESAFTGFVERALAYVTRQPLEELRNVPLAEQQTMLLEALKEAPYLLALDGLERILVAYHRIDAPHLRDDEVEQGEDEAEERRLRAFTDERQAEFFLKLATCAPSRVLISTRLLPSNFQDRHTRQVLPDIQSLHLNGLHPDDALRILTHAGVRGDATAMKTFMAQFGYHSLLVKILAGKVLNYRDAPGDFDAWLPDEGQSWQLSDPDVKKWRTHILKHALEGISDELLRLLCQVAAFRYPVDYAAISALNPYLLPPPTPVAEPHEGFELFAVRRRLENAETDEERARYQTQLDEAEAEFAGRQADYETYQQALKDYEASQPVKDARGYFHAGLNELEERGLLQWDRHSNRYDLHPVVRAYAVDWTATPAQKPTITSATTLRSCRRRTLTRCSTSTTCVARWKSTTL